MAVYLLHATRPLLRANGVAVRHYVGYAPDALLAARVHAHQEGRFTARTPRIVRAFRLAGAHLLLVRVWPNGSPALERTIKSAGHAAALCPQCAGTSSPGKDLPPWLRGQSTHPARNRRSDRPHHQRPKYEPPTPTPPAPEPPNRPATPWKAARTTPATAARTA